MNRITNLYPPKSVENNCIRCEKESEVLHYVFRTTYTPRAKDINRGILESISSQFYCHIPLCSTCIYHIDTHYGVDNIKLNGWDWWDAVDGFPNI